MAVTLKGDCANYLGLSTDDKPTDAAENALFQELDTNDTYYFSNESWHKVGGDS